MPYFDKITVFAPAKVNLHLAIKDKRPDGFHNLESIFLAVDFGDTLHFNSTENDNITEIVMEGLETPIPLEKNIIFKAINLFRNKTDFSQGVKVIVEKRIPPGGGLGGGSSNAASTLLSMNKIAGSPLNRETLLEMAAQLGSDVPFFIHKTPAAWVTGRGEHIKPLKANKMPLVLVNPGFHSDTAAAFRLLDLDRSLKSSRGDVRTEGSKTLRTQREKKGIRYLNNSSALSAPLCLCERSFANYFNDFLDVFGDEERSTYNQIISQLKELGAQYANLSGAGSTCFGIFTENEKVQEAVKTLNSKYKFVQLCYSHCE